MFDRLRRNLSPATVIPTIALFAALGGGYAMAFSGSGTLQKANVHAIPSAEPVTVRSLTGIGRITAQCQTGPDRIQLIFKNTTGKTLSLEGLRSHEGEASVAHSDNVPPDLVANFSDNASAADYFHHWYIQPAAGEGAAGGSKKPQATILISVFSSGCGGGSRVAVLALNTQE